MPKISGLRPAGEKCYLRIPPLVDDRGQTRGGILMRGGILKWNTPDYIMIVKRFIVIEFMNATVGSLRNYWL